MCLFIRDYIVQLSALFDDRILHYYAVFKDSTFLDFYAAEENAVFYVTLYKTAVCNQTVAGNGRVTVIGGNVSALLGVHRPVIGKEISGNGQFQKIHITAEILGYGISPACVFFKIVCVDFQTGSYSGTYIFGESADKIMSAQKARGADFDTGNIFARAKALLPILVPLFVSAFRRADELAIAMESRCYNGGAGRTKMKVLVFGLRDYMAFLIGAAVLAGVIVLVHFGL